MRFDLLPDGNQDTYFGQTPEQTLAAPAAEAAAQDHSHAAVIAAAVVAAALDSRPAATANPKS